MRRLRRTLFCIFLVISGSILAWPDTFLLSTWINNPQGEVGKDAWNNVLGIESGIMESLFDNGHIFFNVYDFMDQERPSLSSEHIRSLTSETGADYLLRLIPDEEGAAWNLYSGDGADIDGDYEDLSRFADYRNDEARWAALGQLVGRNLMDSLN